MTNNDARLTALENLLGAIETHRATLDEAFAENGSMSLLPRPVRHAIAEILRAAARCNAGSPALAGKAD